MQDQQKNRRRFPHLLSIGITEEIADALQRGTRGGLLTVSDTARLALHHGLMASGFIQPTTYEPQGPQQPHTNGGSNNVVPG